MRPCENLSLEDMPGEIWRDIPGWEGFYQISNLGRAKSMKRQAITRHGRIHYMDEKILRQHPNGTQRAYLGFGSHRDGIGGRIYIHKAVARAFIPNPDNKRCVDHINTDTFDNRVENLRWATHSENLRNPITSMRISQAKSGINCFFFGKRLHAKPVICIHPDGSQERFDSLSDAAKAGYCKRSISCCLNGTYSHHRGCKWKYADL